MGRIEEALRRAADERTRPAPPAAVDAASLAAPFPEEREVDDALARTVLIRLSHHDWFHPNRLTPFIRWHSMQTKSDLQKPHELSGIELLRAMVAGRIARPPMADTMGLAQLMTLNTRSRASRMIRVRTA